VSRVRELARPARLAPGARVAVVAPSGPVPEERVQAGLDVLRGWDLDPVLAPHVLDRHGTFDYLAGTDAHRAADLQAAWCDPSVDAVLCARGGYGAQRMADLLDWEAMRAADFVKNTRAQEHLKATLFAPETVREIASGGTPLVPGRARGVTLGGCLTLLAAELGTPHARPSARGGLLCLEDVGEEAYRVDRCLTQLLRAGWLDGVAGVLLGSWEECGPYERLRPLLADRLGGLGVPVAEHVGFGHCEGALTVPFGIPAQFDADTGTLTLDRPALR
jgi:muramoyltetrapeptide carboxypeptidase